MLEKLEKKYNHISELKLKLKKDFILNLKLMIKSWDIIKEWNTIKWNDIKLLTDRYKCINIYLRKRLEIIETKISKFLYEEDVKDLDVNKEKELIY